MQHSGNDTGAKTAAQGTAPSGTTHQYLSFEVAGQAYGIEILRVQEIRSAEHATRIPNTPAHILGVINLRGHVVPIVDLRKRFGLAPAAVTAAAVIVVVRVPLGERTVTAGLLVDAVCEVCTIDAAAVRSAPQVGNGAETRFVDSLAVSSRGLTILLDVQRLVESSLFAPIEQQVA